jgi:hypothetical protein
MQGGNKFGVEGEPSRGYRVIGYDRITTSNGFSH